MFYIVPIVLSYLIGSITFSLVMGKWLKGIDIREHGSGNAGATNTHRILGVGPAITVLVLDIGKGVLAVWLGIWFVPDNLWIHCICGMLAIIGHNWPVFYGFKGGKGIATTIGVVGALCLLPFIIAGIIGVLMIVATRYVSLGSIIFTSLIPIIIVLTEFTMPVFLLSVTIAIFSIVRHKKNIVRLLQGHENKLGSRHL